MKELIQSNKFIGFTIGLVVAILMIFLNSFGLLDQYEVKALDLKFKVKNILNYKPFQDVKVIGIDDASIAKIGRWPWKREEHTKIIDFLKLYGAKAIVYDIFFTYKDTANPVSDEKLVYSTKKAGNVYFASKFIIFDENDGTEIKTKETLLKRLSIQADINVYKDTSDFINKGANIRYELPYGELTEVSKGIGLVHVGKQTDGIIRYQDLIYKYNNRFYPSLVYNVALDNFNIHKTLSYKRGYLLDNMKVPLDEKGRMIVNWKAEFDRKKSTFKPPYEQYSAWRFIEGYDQLKKASIACGVPMEDFKKILDRASLLEKQNKPIPHDLLNYLDKIPPDFELHFGGNNPSDLFKDKIILIGVASNLTTVRDFISTPVMQDVPGVYLHANVLENILSRDFITQVGKSFTDIIILFAGIIVGLLVFGMKDSIKGMIYPIIIALLYLFVVFFDFIKFNLSIDLTYTLGTMIITYTLSSAMDYIIKEKEEAKIRTVISNYIPPQIMNEVMSDPSKLKLGGAKKEITILFSDIRGFTTITEKQDPQQVVSMLNQYLSAMVDVIFRNNGTVDKFIGDAIMAFWNAPISVENHEFLAIKTALEMLEELKKLNEKFNLHGKTGLNIGIAINTGDVIIGNIGSEKIKDYTIIGDAVNLTSRMESLNKKYLTRIIISEFTYERVKDRINTKFLGDTSIEGKDNTVKIYEVLGIKAD